MWLRVTCPIMLAANLSFGLHDIRLTKCFSFF